jgi:hypothetical protein
MMAIRCSSRRLIGRRSIDFDVQTDADELVMFNDRLVQVRDQFALLRVTLFRNPDATAPATVFRVLFIDRFFKGFELELFQSSYKTPEDRHFLVSIQQLFSNRQLNHHSSIL